MSKQSLFLIVDDMQNQILELILLQRKGDLQSLLQELNNRKAQGAVRDDCSLNSLYAIA